jgi:hypothetical protein
MSIHFERRTPVVLGLKITDEDHAYVRSLSVVGIPTLEICVRLGARFELGKPMSKLTMYHHFRADLVKRPCGRRPKEKIVRPANNDSLKDEMRKMLMEVDSRDKANRKT